MLIKKIKLHPFAGINDLEVSLQKGMNVIHGSNEAGKSTILKAIEFAFFSPAKLMKKDRDRLESFLPKTGGDTVSVAIDFSIGDNDYTLTRMWGGTESSNLSGTDIGKITNAENVMSKLSDLLSLNQASWKNILFSRQSELSDTFQNISNESEIKNSISDILRSSVISSAGISIENMKNSIEETIAEYFNNWDETTNRPRGGHEIDNRWKVKIGKILNSYYELEQAKFDLKNCMTYDEKMDACIKQITESNLQIGAIKKYFEEFTPIVQDAQTRKIQDAKENAKQLQLNNLNNDAKDWNTYNASLPEKQKLFKTLEKEPEKLKIELETALKKEGITEKKNKLKKAWGIVQKIETLKNELKKKKKVNDDDLEKYEELKNDLRGLNSDLKAQKLIFNVKAKSDIDGLLQKGIDEKKKIKLKKGQSVSGESSGRIYLETDDIIVSVESGTENISSLTRKIETRQLEIDKLNKKYSVESYKDLEELHAESADILSNIDNQEGNIETILDGEKIEKLKKEIRGIDTLPSVRSSKKINEEIVEKSKQLELVKKEITDINSSVTKLERQYRSFDELSEKQLEVKGELNDIKKKLSHLKPLPAGKNIDSIINEYNSKISTQEKLKGDLTNSLVSKAELREPEFSSEELKEKISAFKNDFELKQKEGQAYKKIYETLNSILASESNDVFKPFSEQLCTYFSALTQGKYSKVSVNEVLPTTIENDKITLPIDLLSKGTKDALALAQKLSMAGYYLRNSEGFLVLDDPLTDLDPGRETAAVKVLCEFAKKKQLIIFTCDPVHAKMFGIKEIHLN